MPRPCWPPPPSTRPCAARPSALPTSPGWPTCSNAGRRVARSKLAEQARNEALKPGLPNPAQPLRRQDRAQAGEARLEIGVDDDVVVVAPMGDLARRRGQASADHGLAVLGPRLQPALQARRIGRQ